MNEKIKSLIPKISSLQNVLKKLTPDKFKMSLHVIGLLIACIVYQYFYFIENNEKQYDYLSNEITKNDHEYEIKLDSAMKAIRASHRNDSLTDMSYNYLAGYDPKISVSGDFNGDGKREIAYMNEPSNEDPDERLVISFSDINMPVIYCYSTSYGFLYNEGDLNNDGADDLGFFRTCCTNGSWRDYTVFFLSQNKWVDGLNIPTHFSVRTTKTKLVTKLKNKPGYIRIKYNDPDDYSLTDDVIKVKIIKLDSVITGSVFY